jgi:elongation factor G
MEPALISLDITPKTPADREKLARAPQAVAAEDGNLEVRAGVEPDCTVIGATSEAHLEEIVDRLKREFEVEARVGRPTVAYLETLTRSAEGSAKHVKMGPRPRRVRSRFSSSASSGNRNPLQL